MHIIRGNRVVPFALSVVLCASLKNFTAVSYPEEGGKGNLQLWKFGDQLPRWSVETDNPPSTGRISPSGARVVTFYTAWGKDPAYICVRDIGDGGLLARLLFELPSSENMAIACFVDYLTLMPTYGFLFLII